MSRYSHISVAIPMLAELENVPVLLEALTKQRFQHFTLYCCVNNPEGWECSASEWEREAYDNNQQTLRTLYACQQTLPFNLHVIDCSSPDKGWVGKRKGVGWARKVLFSAICKQCGDDELIVSLDADTVFSEKYLDSVASAMNANPGCSCLCVPYHHPLSGDEANDRAMLRYEIYMRHYLINLLESGNPYAFTALGSAMAFPAWAYRRVGGITPLQGGEDFYLMQKFAKTGQLLLQLNECVQPQGRASQRVPFGTGPAIAKGVAAMSEQYPLYPAEGFDAVAKSYQLFPNLYDTDVETPMSQFLRQQLRTEDLWEPLRQNFHSLPHFVHACQERVDGLRILQYLRTWPVRKAEEELSLFCNNHRISIPPDFNFTVSAIEEIDSVRNQLFRLEMTLR